jgi:hypothetical protein
MKEVTVAGVEAYGLTVVVTVMKEVTVAGVGCLGTAVGVGISRDVEESGAENEEPPNPNTCAN